jgi:hypothetical protein
MTTNATTDNNPKDVSFDSLQNKFLCVLCECYEARSEFYSCFQCRQESLQRLLVKKTETEEEDEEEDCEEVFECNGCEDCQGTEYTHEAGYTEYPEEPDEPDNPKELEMTEVGEEWVYADTAALMEKPPGSMDRTVFVNNISEINRLSVEAQKFIDNHFDINNILRIRETMQPEDFDEEGPTEENWDLFLQTADNKVHYFSYHHFWSHGGERPGYSVDKY